jgi:hypothetical protein
MESIINTGYITKNGAVLDPNMLMQAGQGKQIVVNEGYDVNADIREITPQTSHLDTSNTKTLSIKTSWKSLVLLTSCSVFLLLVTARCQENSQRLEPQTASKVIEESSTTLSKPRNILENSSSNAFRRTTLLERSQES